MLEMKALAEATAMIVKAHVAEAVTPLLARIETLESRPTEPDNVVILRLVEQEVAKIPAPENGKDADPEQVASLVAETVERAVAALPVPQDGKSIVVEDVAPLIAEEVGRAVAELPVPKDGKDGTDGKDGKDAAGIVEALKDNGELVLTLQDGRLVRTGVRDGDDGKDGADGFSLDDFDCEPVDERTIKLKFTRGDLMHSFELEFPVVIYRDVFKAGESYAHGDAVTWGGSLWIAQKATDAKPDSPDSGWKLAVKKGRDGKDAK